MVWLNLGWTFEFDLLSMDIFNLTDIYNVYIGRARNVLIGSLLETQ